MTVREHVSGPTDTALDFARALPAESTPAPPGGLLLPIHYPSIHCQGQREAQSGADTMQSKGTISLLLLACACEFGRLAWVLIMLELLWKSLLCSCLGVTCPVTRPTGSIARLLALVGCAARQPHRP